MAGCGVLITFVFFIYIVSWDRAQLVGLGIPLRLIAKPSYSPPATNPNVVCNSPNFRDENQFRKLTGALYLETALRKAVSAMVCNNPGVILVEM